MQKTVSILLFTLVLNLHIMAQEFDLIGSTIRYEYKNGSEVEASFTDDLYNFHWISGSYKGIKGSVPYQYIKLSKKKYVINFYVESHSSYVTLFFNFRNNELIGSAIIIKNGEVIKSIEKAEIKHKEIK